MRRRDDRASGRSRRQPWLRSAASAAGAARRSTAGGRPARFVGGCVRDGLLGRMPAGAELDLATAGAARGR